VKNNCINLTNHNLSCSWELIEKIHQTKNLFNFALHNRTLLISSSLSSSESIAYHHVSAFLLHSILLTHFFMIGNIDNMSDRSFLNDLSADQIPVSEAPKSVIVAQGTTQCNYHCFKFCFKFITLLAFLGMHLSIKC
jgi:thiosulfate reductase cytochrome b subunit